MGKIKAVDIMTRFKLSDVIQQDPLATYSYQLRDGDRPDIIANRYYGSADYAWIVLLSNDYFSVKDSFPLSSEQLLEYAKKTYGDPYSLHHYEDPDGDVIDQTTYLATSGSKAVTNLEYESKINENKRFIKLVSKVYLRKILDSLEEKLSAINETK
jgi:hypothetical protein